MATGWQSARQAAYHARVDRALDTLPPFDFHCLCLRWRQYHLSWIAYLLHSSEDEVRAAIDRAVTHLVRQTSHNVATPSPDQPTSWLVNRVS